MAKKKSKFLSGKRIDPTPIDKKTALADLIDESFMAYNAARLREACQLFTRKMLEPDTTVGVTLTGALTPAGLGISALIPLIKAGFIDWIISTGANLYHDTHFGIGLSLHQGDAKLDDRILREEEVVRIFDIFFDYSVLLDTDEFFRRLIEHDEFQKTMSSAEFHYLAGKYIREREKKLGIKDKSLLAVCYEYGVPVYTSSPGDSSIGMNIAAKELQGGKLILNPNLDVNETASIVLAAKRGVVHTGKKQKKGGKSAIFILGGGSPKNFALQTEPQIQEVFGIDEKGHDYFLQVDRCASRHGRTYRVRLLPRQSVGEKLIPTNCPMRLSLMLIRRSRLPLITTYALARHEPREPKRLYDRRDEFMKLLQSEYEKSTRR